MESLFLVKGALNDIECVICTKVGICRLISELTLQIFSEFKEHNCKKDPTRVVLRFKYFLSPTHHLSNSSWQIIRLLKAKGAVDDPSQEGADRWCSLQMWGSGDHKNTGNYRPIGLSPSYPKLPETAKPAHFLSKLGVNRPPLPFHNSGTIRPCCKTSAY